MVAEETKSLKRMSLRGSTLETERDGIPRGVKMELESLERSKLELSKRKKNKAAKNDIPFAEDGQASFRHSLKKKAKRRGKREEEPPKEQDEDIPVAVIDTGMDTVKVVEESESCFFYLLYGNRLDLLVMMLLDQYSLH